MTSVQQLRTCAAGMILIATMLSCGGNPAPATSQDSLTSAPVPTATRRDSLVSALQALAKGFHSQDPQSLARWLTFPVPDTMLLVYVDEPAFAAALEKNNGQLTQQVFLDYYPQIRASVMATELDTLFQLLDRDLLRSRDTAQQSVATVADPCAKYYRVTIEGDVVALVTGMEGNERYTGDPEDSSSEMCESAAVWVFYFDGKRLRLKQHAIAG